MGIGVYRNVRERAERPPFPDPCACRRGCVASSSAPAARPAVDPGPPARVVAVLVALGVACIFVVQLVDMFFSRKKYPDDDEDDDPDSTRPARA